MNPPEQRLTLRSLAKRLGLSHATVSMALRGRPGVAQKTKQRVCEAAESCGYRPDPMLGALAAYRKRVKSPGYQGHIAWLYDHPTLDAFLARPISRQYYEGACRQAEEMGFRVEPYSLTDIAPHLLSGVLEARGVRGIMVAPLDRTGMTLALDWDKFASVALGFHLASPRLDMIGSAHNHIALAATRKLYDLGYQRVGFLTSRAFEEQTDRDFTSGFLSASMDVPDACRPLSIKEDAPAPAISAAIKEWVIRSRLEAVLCNSRLLPHLTKAGFAIPEDFAVVLTGCLDNSPGFAGLDENGLRVGAMAAEHLAHMIQRGERGLPEVPRFLLVDGTWIDGKSAPPRPQKPHPSRALKTAVSHMFPKTAPARKSSQFRAHLDAVPC